MAGGRSPVMRSQPPRFGAQATIQDWTRFSQTHDRLMRACILEWILMDPSRDAVFIDRISVAPRDSVTVLWLLHLCHYGPQEIGCAGARDSNLHRGEAGETARRPEV